MYVFGTGYTFAYQGNRTEVVDFFKILRYTTLRSVKPKPTGMWRSLVARFVRDEEVAGSNPVIPTILHNFKANNLEVFYLDSLQGCEELFHLAQALISHAVKKSGYIFIQ